MKQLNIWISVIVLVLHCNGISAQNLGLGLIACYPFNGNANDQSGNGHNGNAIGPVLTTDRFNSPNSAFYFDGSNDYINLGSFSNFTNSNNFSLSAWIQPDQVKLQTILMLNPDNFTDRLNAMAYYDHNGSSTTFWDFGNCVAGGRLAQVGTNFSNSWQHWVFVVSQTTGMSVYKNGVLQTSQVSYSQVVNRNRNLFIGGGSDASNAQFFFKGKIDDLRLYDRDLTLSEIQMLYTQAPSCIPTSLAENALDGSYNVFISENTLIINTASTAPESEFQLFNLEGKLVYSGKIEPGPQTLRIPISVSSAIMIYTIKSASGTLSGKTTSLN